MITAGWVMPPVWEGGECWIIGGGLSMPRQFNIPEDVIQAVSTGKAEPSAYSPYMKGIHKKHIIGVNMAFKIGDWIDICFFGDRNFFNRVKYELSEFPGLKISCRSKFNPAFEIPGVKLMSREHRKTLYGIGTIPGHVRWNGNSGGAAINIAAHAGVKRIILLGFDMKNEGKTTHWHFLYGQKNLKTLPYDKHLICFPYIARDAKHLGIEIINANPDSAINCFKKVPLKELL